MKTFSLFHRIARAATTALLAGLPSLAHAHPGHDGHELTWDLGHLAAHPFATLGWLTVLAAALWLVKSVASKAGRVSSRAPSQDLRHR